MQQERLRALGQMASGIAHDINNAISPVALYTECLLEHEPGLSERGAASPATSSSARSTTWPPRWRACASSTASAMRRMTLAPVQLNPLVAAGGRADARALERHAAAARRRDPGCAPSWRRNCRPCSASTSEMREALINLVFNAVDAMPEGGVLTLRTRSAPPANGDAAAPHGRASR